MAVKAKRKVAAKKRSTKKKAAPKKRARKTAGKKKESAKDRELKALEFDLAASEKVLEKAEAEIADLKDRNKQLEDGMAETVREAAATVSKAGGGATKLVLRELMRTLVRCPGYKKIRVFLPRKLMQRVKAACQK